MAVRPEVLAQLARMLGDAALRSASDVEVRSAADAAFERLAEAMVSEIMASDDVVDGASAEAYTADRLASLATVLREDQVARLGTEVRARLRF